MADEPQNSNGSRLNKLADNAIGKLVMIYVVPVLAVVAGFLIQDKLSQITATQHLFWNEIGKISSSQSDVKRDVAVIVTGMAAHKVDDDIFENNTKTVLQDHEVRLRALSLSAPTPLPRLRSINPN